MIDREERVAESKALASIDTPEGLTLSLLERKIIEGLVSKKSAKDLSMELGIPRIAITNLVRRDGVSDFIQELIDARNQMMKMFLPDLLMDIIEDKVAKNQEDDEKRTADLSKKDVVDIAKQLDSLIKTTSSPKLSGESDDKFTQIYNQIAIIQKQE